jgi:hypothetical protein
LFELITKYDFPICHYIFIQNEKEKKSLFPDEQTKILIALECIYETNEFKYWNHIKEIFETLHPSESDPLFKKCLLLKSRMNAIEIMIP